MYMRVFFRIYSVWCVYIQSMGEIFSKKYTYHMAYWHLGIVLAICFWRILIVQAYDPHCMLDGEYGKYCPTDLGNLSRNLIAYYPFSPPNRYQDVTGITGNLVDTGNVQFQSDCAWSGGECPYFDGNNFFRIPDMNPGALSAARGFTICSWAKRLTSGDLSRIFEFYSTYQHWTYATPYSLNILVVRSRSGNNIDDIRSTSAYTMGIWHHWCVINRGATWQISHDGVIEVTKTLNHVLLDIKYTPVYIARGSLDTGSSNIFVDDFRIYDRVLTASEVAMVYEFRQYTCPPGTFQDKQENCTDNTDSAMIGYYSFCPENRFKDTIGSNWAGDLTIGTGAGPTYVADGPWTGSQAVQFTGNTYLTGSRTINIATWQATTGVSACWWFRITDYSLNTGRFFWRINNFYAKTTATGIQINAGAFPGEISVFHGYAVNVWHHVCILVNTANMRSVFDNGWSGMNTVTAAFAYSVPYELVVGASVSGATPIVGLMDELRFYKKWLTTSEVSALYLSRPIACVWTGQCRGVAVTSTCQSCPIGRNQPYPGQQNCLACAGGYASYYGTVKCASDFQVGPRPSATSSTTPGTIVYTVGPNYLSFHCPAGTYSPTVVSLTTTLLTNAFVSNNNVACGGTPCVWTSSQLDTWVNNGVLIDGIVLTTSISHTKCNVDYPFTGIDFGVSKYVEGVFVFDRDDANAVRFKNARMYIGNVLLPSGATTTTPTAGSDGWGYPIADTQNTLCFTNLANDNGYRSPLYAPCKASGRYLYIVGTANRCQNLREIIVLETSPCPVCKAGTYSVYAQPNTKCSECPVGTYNTGIGMSACTSCPSGYIQPETGKSYCTLAAPAGSYNPAYGSAYDNDLIAHYSFWNTGPLVDGSGVTGPLTQGTGVDFVSACKDSNDNACANFTNSNPTTLTIPPIDWRSLADADGFTYCFWFRLVVGPSGAWHTLWRTENAGALSFYSVKHTGTNQMATFIFSNAGASLGSVSSVILIYEHNWYHMCVTAKGLVWNCYANGAWRSSLTIASPMLAGLRPTLLGYGIISGNMDDVRIYKRAITTDEYAALYAYAPISPCPAGSYSPARANDVDIDLIAWYSFWPNNELTDGSGQTGSLINNGAMFTSSCAWNNQQCVVFSSSTYLSLPSINIGARSNADGITVCLWVNFVNSVNQEPIFDISNGPNSNNFLLFRWISTSNFGLKTWKSNTNVLSWQVTSSVITVGQWTHVCITNLGTAYNFYQDGVWKQSTTASDVLLSVAITSGKIGGDNWGSHSTVSVDDFRIYSSVVSAARIQALYLTRSTSFSLSSVSSSLSVTDTCPPCPIGFFQASTGQSACQACQYATWHGSVKCDTSKDRLNGVPLSGITGTPGMAMLTVGANYIRMNCPAGTFSTVTVNLQRLTDGCTFSWYISPNTGTCTAGTCCIWGTTQFGANSASLAYDGSLVTRNFVSHTNNFHAIDFLESRYVDSLVVYTALSNENTGLENLLVYVGNTLHAFNNARTTTTTSFPYPIATQANTLCAIEPSAKTGYRNPTVLRCAASGRYVYLVHNNPDYAGFSVYQIIVLGQTVCPLCQPGTYSYDTIPTVKCSQCPAGTFQTGSGMSFCATCPSGTYQTGLGMTSASRCISLNTGLIAHYTFSIGGRLLDSTGITGDISSVSGDIRYQPDCAWVGASCSILTSTSTFVLPSIDLGSLAVANGFTICTWYMLNSVSNTQKIFRFATSATDVNSISVSRFLSDNYLQIRYWKSSVFPTGSMFSSAKIALNVWTHLCLSFTGTTLKIFVNGQAPNTYTTTSLGGAQVYTYNNIGFDAFSGGIDDFRIYNRGLSNSEVTALYNLRDTPCSSQAVCYPGRYCPVELDASCGNLIAYYSFWVTTTTRLIDATGLTGDLTSPSKQHDLPLQLCVDGCGVHRFGRIQSISNTAQPQHRRTSVIHWDNPVHLGEPRRCHQQTPPSSSSGRAPPTATTCTYPSYRPSTDSPSSTQPRAPSPSSPCRSPRGSGATSASPATPPTSGTSTTTDCGSPRPRSPFPRPRSSRSTSWDKTPPTPSTSTEN
jgi:hypothetical protein